MSDKKSAFNTDSNESYTPTASDFENEIFLAMRPIFLKYSKLHPKRELHHLMNMAALDIVLSELLNTETND